MPVDVCYLVSNGFSARMVLQSDVIAQLTANGHSVAIVTPNADEPDMRAAVAALGVTVLQAPDMSTGFYREYQRLRRYFFENVRENASLWYRHQQLVEALNSNWRGLKYRLYLGMNRVALRSRIIRAALETAEKTMLRNQEIAALLEQLQPRTVVSTYPIDAGEACFLHEATRKGLTTVGQLLSWDNITTKGLFPVTPDYYLSWGPVMTEEIRTYYDTPSDHIFECGVAHFDQHLSMRDSDVRAKLLVDLGLDPTRPYLFFGMSSPYYTPYEIEIVEWLAEAVRRDTFGRAMQLVVRPHPQNVQGNGADWSWLPRLEALVGDRVAVNFPMLRESRLSWNMERDDMRVLVNLLAGCSVCLNSGSTISLDAMVHDKPVVLTSFDAGHSLPWHQSARHVLDRTHMAKLVSFGGVQVVQAFGELETAVQRYLENPDLDADRRRITREMECGLSDGRASERIADALRAILGDLKPLEQAA